MRILYHIPLVHSSGEVATDFSVIDSLRLNVDREALKSDVKKIADSLSEDYWDAFEPAFWKEKINCSRLAVYMEGTTESRTIHAHEHLDGIREGRERFEYDMVWGKSRNMDFLNSLMF